MFESVRGKKIKDFFNPKRGRNLSFPPNKPVKIQAGVDIDQIAKSAVEKNIDNLIIASLKANIEDLKIQLAVKNDRTLQSKLEWATEYLEKFTREVAKVKKNNVTHSEEDLKRIFNNIKIQSERVLSSLTKLSFAIVHDKMDEIKLGIQTINEQTLLYEQSVQSYQTKGGKEEYAKIVYEKLRNLYKQIAKKLEELKDELKNSPDNYELKQNISMLEKFADDLVKYAVSPAEYQTMRTEVDKEIADERKRTQNPNPPAKPTYQSAVEAYEAELNKLNSTTIELNKCIARVEALMLEKDLTPEMMAEYIALDTQINQYAHQIKKSQVALATIVKNAKDTHKIDISKLTCIEKIKKEKVEFKTEYQTYIESLDRKALEVIKRMKELVLSKTNAKKETVDKINQEIMVQYQFLSSINSLIELRMVHQSKVFHKNLNELQKERWSRRKEMAAEYGLVATEPQQTPPSGKTELEDYKEKVLFLSEQWLLAIKLAPISRSGNILIDEKAFVDEMTTLVAQANTAEKIKIVTDASDLFNKSRTEIIKAKRSALSKLRNIITTRISLIFRSGTIEPTVVEGRDVNEWLTVIEYNELLLLISEPEYKDLIPNAQALVDKYIEEQEKKYQKIKKNEQVETIESLSAEFASLIANVEPIQIDDDFEAKITAMFEAMKIRYKSLKDFEYRMDIATNTVTINYTATQYEYSSGAYKFVPIEFSHVIMSVSKHKDYQVKKGIKPTTPNPVDEPKPDQNEEPSAEINLGEGVPSNVTVTNRTIRLATTRRQVIDRAKSLIIKNASPLTVSLINQGLRIKYNEHLRDQLKALNAKLSLVHKENYRSRKDMRFDTDVTEQDLAFRTPKDNFNIDDYKLEIRLVDDEKKRSDLLYTYDLENISEELRGRSK